MTVFTTKATVGHRSKMTREIHCSTRLTEANLSAENRSHHQITLTQSTHPLIQNHTASTLFDISQLDLQQCQS